jgi:hypothetical protein
MQRAVLALFTGAQTGDIIDPDRGFCGAKK